MKPGLAPHRLCRGILGLESATTSRIFALHHKGRLQAVVNVQMSACEPHNDASRATSRALISRRGR